MKPIKTFPPNSYKTLPVTTHPTRQCLICDNPENTSAVITDLSKPWLCESCKSKLRVLIGMEVTDDA